MPRTSSRYDIEIIDSLGNVTGLMFAKTGQPGDGTPPSMAEGIAAASADAQLSKQLIPTVHVNTGGGVGVDYNEAVGVYSRTPGFYCPAGALTQVQVPLGVGFTNTAIVAIAEFGGDVWFGQAGAASVYGGRIFRSIGGSAAPSATVFTATGLGYLPAGEYLRDLIVADNGSGVSTLYASSSDSAGLNGRLHRWDTGASQWVSTAAALFGTNGRNRMAKVFWETQNGDSAWRLVTINGAKTISYTGPNKDPMLAASWTESAFKVDTAFTLLELVAARRHVYVTAQDGLYDLDGMGNAPNLTSYLADESQAGTGVAGIYHNNYVYMSSGKGVDRVYVGASGQLQERPGQCAPGWGTPAENKYRGYATAFCSDQGYTPVAIWNQSSQVSGIWWMLDQETQGSRNPTTAYGPEFAYAADYKVTRMKTSGAAGDLRLWVAAQSVAGGTPVLHWGSLPVAGSPLQDLLSAGGMKFNTGATGVFNPGCYVAFMADTFGDEISSKIVDRQSAGSRGLSINGAGVNDGNGTKLTVSTRANPEPGSATWGTGVDITTSATQTVLPATATSGNRIETKVEFISPQGGASTPKIGVLTSLRPDVWRTAPDVGTWRPVVEYGTGVIDLKGDADDRDPDTTTATLRALPQQSRITVRDRQNHRWTVHMEQVFDADNTLMEGEKDFGKTVRRQLEFSVIGQVD